MADLITHKIIKSGDIVERYVYEKGYLKGYEMSESDVKAREEGFGDESEEEIRERSLRRAKTNLRRLVNANVGQYGEGCTAKFLTLTFRENIRDVKNANYYFTKFIKRLNYAIKSILKYTAVVEFQKRGAIHYHVILYNMPFVHWEKILKVWKAGNKDGGIWINKIDDVENVGAYVGEYLGQSDKGQGRDVDDDRLKGQKSYFSSRGLYKPIEITEKEKVEALAEALPNHKIIYSASFENEHVGKVSYVQYNLKLS